MSTTPSGGGGHGHGDSGPTFGSYVLGALGAMFGTAIVFTMLSDMVTNSRHPFGTVMIMIISVLLPAAIYLIATGKVKVGGGGGGHGPTPHP